MITDPGFHGRGHTKGLVDPAEVIIHEVQGDGMDVVLNLLGEPIGQPGEAPHRHPHCEVLAFDIGG